MAGIFVLGIIPATLLVLGVAGVWLQARANRAVQVHVKRLDELNAAAAAVAEQPTAQITPNAKTPIRAAGQFSLPLAVWLSGLGGLGVGRIRGQSRIVS